MRDKKNYLLGGLFAAVVLMAVGYAALAQNLVVNGTATVTGKWNVHFAGIDENTSSGDVVVNNTTAEGTTATFNVSFKSPGDFAEFDITIANDGTIPAILRGVTVAPDYSAVTNGIKYTVTGVTEGSSLAVGATQKITVRAEWLAGDTQVPEETSKTVSVTLNYEQDTNA